MAVLFISLLFFAMLIFVKRLVNFAANRVAQWLFARQVYFDLRASTSRYRLLPVLASVREE